MKSIGYLSEKEKKIKSSSERIFSDMSVNSSTVKNKTGFKKSPSRTRLLPCS